MASTSRRLKMVALAMLFAVWVVPTSAPGDEPGFASECIPAPLGAQVSLTFGAVQCQRIPSAFLGAETAFSYYIPPACRPGKRCPVLYLLHGTGGSYETMLGPVGGPPTSYSLGWIEALTSGPTVDPRRVPDPWNYGDPTAWEPLAPLDLILVAPHNKTLEGGFGPAPDVEGWWGDWNPRYAEGGDSQRYATPPPRFESFFVKELIPFVDAHFPTGAGRDWRAINGRSQGGYGALKLGLQHPDLFASVGSISAGGLPTGYARVHPSQPDSPVHLASPVDLPYTPLPGPVMAVYPAPDQLPPGFPRNSLTNIATSLLFFWGDPVADEAYLRGQNPVDLSMNAGAHAGGVQSLHLRAIVNDAIPRRAADFEDPSGYVSNQFFEAGAVGISLSLIQAFEADGIEYVYEIHPGIHTPVYHRPFYRQILAAHYANLRHRDGSGNPPPSPTRFDYRSVATDFDIWGWAVHVDRSPVEFLNLRDASCEAVTLQGSGVVTMTVPEGCGTGLDGSRTFAVDLGPSFPTDEHTGARSAGAYGNSVRVTLQPL